MTAQVDAETVQPVGDRLLIRREAMRLRAGLVLPPQNQWQCFGRVLAVGESFGLDKEGKPKEALANIVGRRILFDPNTTYEFPGDTSLLLMPAIGVWAILADETPESALMLTAAVN